MLIALDQTDGGRQLLAAFEKTTKFDPIPPETLHPCSDSYEKVETGEKVVVYSTLERHLAMPRTVASPADLYALNGVRP